MAVVCWAVTNPLLENCFPRDCWMASPTHLVSTLTTAVMASAQDTPHHPCPLHMEHHPPPMGSHPPAMKLPVLVMDLHPNPPMTLHPRNMVLHPNLATKLLKLLMFHLHPN